MVAHGLELANCLAACFLWVESGEVVATGIVVGGVGGGDVPDRDEQCPLDGDVGAQRTSTGCDPAVTWQPGRCRGYGRSTLPRCRGLLGGRGCRVGCAVI